MIITGLIITAIVVFFITSIFPGLMVSIMVLGGPGVDEYSKFRQYATGIVACLGTGLVCTVGFFIMVPVAIVGFVMTVLLLIFSEITNYLSRR